MKCPNIIFLLTDNQRYNLMRCAGNPIIYTPHVDNLANQGMRFTNAFATTPICAASRASLLTGLYERRHQFTFNTPPLRSEFTDISYPTLLRSAGYYTGFIGKFGIESNSKLLVENKKETLGKMFDVFDNFEHWGPNGYLVKQEDGSMKHLTDVTADKVVSFLHGRKQGKPFCLSVSFNAPHAQDNVPQQYFWPSSVDHLYQEVTIPNPANSSPDFFANLPDFLQQSLGRERWFWRFDGVEKFQQMMKGLYRMVSGVDTAIGRIRKEIKQLGLEDNTIIIFMSDHGMFYGERGLSDCWLLYEDCIRVPLIIFDPRLEETTNYGTLIEQMALNLDIAPTILELAGLDAPKVTQGCSLVPLLTDCSPQTWRTDFCCEHLFDHPKIPKSEGIRTERWKYIQYFEQQPIYEELYDLKRDTQETTNLIDDIALVEETKHLRKRFSQLRQEAEGIQ